MHECVCVCEVERGSMCVQRLRALFCTGAIKDTLERERDYRKKNIITHKWCFFFLSQNKYNKYVWVWEAPEQSFTWYICLEILQMQQFTATYIFEGSDIQFVVTYWSKHILQPKVNQPVSCERRAKQWEKNDQRKSVKKNLEDEKREKKRMVA